MSDLKNKTQEPWWLRSAGTKIDYSYYCGFVAPTEIIDILWTMEVYKSIPYIRVVCKL